MRLVSMVLIAAVGCGNKSPAAGGDDDTSPDGGTGSDGSDGSGTNPTTVAVTLNHRPTNASALSFIVAFQDGAGPWMLAPAPTGDTYALPIHAPVYAVAWTCIAAGQNGQARQVNEYQFAVSEKPALTIDIPARCRDQANLVTLEGTLANTGTFTNYVVKFGERTAVVGDNDRFMLQTPPGTHDLVVLGQGSISINSDIVAEAAYVQRNLAVTAHTELMIDADDLADLQAFDVTGIGGNLRDTATTTLYANGTTALLVNDSNFGFETESLAADQMATGDLYDQQIAITTIDGQTARSLATATPAAQAWTAVPALGAITTTAAAGLVTSSWAGYANATGYTWLVNQALPSNQCGGGGACSITWTAQISASVLGAAPEYTMPDLTAVTGWNNALNLAGGRPATGGVQAVTSSAQGDFPLQTPPPIGTARTFAATSLTITP